MKAMQSGLRLAKPATGLSPRWFQTANKRQIEAAAVLDNVDVDVEWDAAKPYTSIPGPKPLPIPYVGNVWRLMPTFGKWGQDMTLMHRELYQMYGPIVRLAGMGRADMVMLYDPADVEKMFRNESVWPERMAMGALKYYRTVLRKDFYGDWEGLVTRLVPTDHNIGGTAAYNICSVASKDKQWADFRTATNQTMMQPRNILTYLNSVETVADDFTERIRYIRNPENKEMPEDFMWELNKVALEAVGVVTLDTRLGCLAKDLKPDSDAMRMIENTKSVLALMQKLEFGGSPWKFISTPTWRKFVKTMDEILEITVRYTNAKWETIKKQGDAEDKPNKSILETLLLKTKDPKIPIVMTTDSIFAGIDTTANAIGTALYHLAINPDKQELLFQELRRLLPTKDAKLTKETFNEMKYLRAVIKESMRLNPTAGANQRITKKDLVLQGYQVPTGTSLISAHQIMCSLDKYFPEAQKFLPERWIRTESQPDTAAKLTNPFVFLPFGFGQRSCVGKRIAELEIDLVLSKIIRNFEIRYDYGPMTWETRLVTAPKKPLKFKMTDRPE